jgi:hypothetical protein
MRKSSPAKRTQRKKATPATPQKPVPRKERGNGSGVPLFLRERAPSEEPASPLAVTRDAQTTLSNEVSRHPDRDHIVAHEAAHRRQFEADAPQGSRRELEHDAERGATRITAGLPYHPNVSAPPAMILAYGPEDWLPNLESQGSEEVSALGRAGLTDDTNRISGATETQQGMDGGATARYVMAVSASGRGGSIDSNTTVNLSHEPDARVGVVGRPTVMVDVETGLAPVDDRPAYPYRLSYSRTITYRDTNGRTATVEVDGVVFFSEQTLASQISLAGTPSYEALLGLAGDSGYMTASLHGSGAIAGYFANYTSRGDSLTIQSRGAQEGFGRTGLSFITTSEPAAFLDPRMAAGDQYSSLRRYLMSADAAELMRQRAAAAAAAEPPDWFDELTEALADVIGSVLAPIIELTDRVATAIEEWWNDLPPWARGVLTAIGKFAVALGVMAAIAGLIVVAAEGAIGFGVAMLIVGAIALAAGFVMSFWSRLVEAWNSDSRWNLLGVPLVAVLDTLGISGIIQGITNESILTGAPMGMSEEEQWESGTTGVIQLVGIILMVRGMRGGPQGRTVAPEVRGNIADFHALPVERLPVLPEGHYWVRQGAEWTVFREPTAPEVPLEISIYSDGQGNINFNVRTGPRVLQSDAMTRDPTYQGGENRLPPELRGTGPDNPYLEQGTGTRYDKGHGVDYADRLEGPGARSSNADPANFTPQARYWNSFLRNHLVGAIRSRGGGYRELPIYDSNPPQTVNGIPIPREFVFVETSPTGEPVAAWRIPNDPNIATYQQAQLPQYRIPLTDIPRAMLRPNGTVQRPGTMVGPQVIWGQAGDEEDH